MVYIYKLIFFISLFMIFYVYLIYPVCVYILSKFIYRTIYKGDTLYDVTIIIAAYNEEKVLEKTIQNKLSLDYPKEKLDIIVVSDESTDGTDDIVKKYSSMGVTLLRQTPRAGKTSALNKAVPMAKGDIIFFSDANSIHSADTLKRILRNFNDEKVGYVTGKMIYTDPEGSIIGDGCTAYMKYENKLRELETLIGSIVGVDGGIDAIRKELYEPMTPDQLPDFVLPLKVLKSGYRVVYEPDAVLKESSLKMVQDEYRMRVRVALRALWALSDMRELLNPKKFQLISWQIWSHKLLRYLCFIFLISAYISNFMLIGSGLSYTITFFLQTIAYICSILSPTIEKKGYRFGIIRFCYYFILINAACAHAFFKFLLRQKVVVWNPRKG